MEKEVKRFSSKKSFSSYVLGADIGGTKTSIGVFGVKQGKTQLLLKFGQHTTDQHPIDAVSDALSYAKTEGYSVKKIVMAVAGPVDNDCVKLTNAPWEIKKKKVLRKLKNCTIHLINDFVAMAYGINVIGESDVYELFKRTAQKNGTKAIIGAGTGLGKSVLYYDEKSKSYIPKPTEGGHTSLAVINKKEYGFLQYLRKQEKKKIVVYEDVLSGKGLVSLYRYFRIFYKPTKYTREIDLSTKKASLISKYKAKDPTCKETFACFARFYGRFARNAIVSTLCVGGLYIGGGIASKNLDVFRSKEFKSQLNLPCPIKKMISQAPIYVLTQYDLGLRGAGYAAYSMK